MSSTKEIEREGERERGRGRRRRSLRCEQGWMDGRMNGFTLLALIITTLFYVWTSYSRLVSLKLGVELTI
jgi:hypothetical protein